MTMPIYVFSSGGVANEVLNAVVALLGNNFSDAIWIATVLAGFMSCFTYIKTHDIRIFVTFFLVNMLISSILLAPKVTVQIIDTTDPLATHFVDHVPWGLAFPASMSSTFMYGLTQFFGDTFHMPNDLEYNQTGMLFGARLLVTTLQNTQFDGTTKENFNNFVENCIIPDIYIKKYTWNEIANSQNIFQTLDQYSMSPLRGIYVDQQFQTCAAVYPTIKKEISSSANKQLSALAVELFGMDSSKYQGVLPDMIQHTYAYMLNNTASSAQDILMQNTMINYFRNTMSTVGAKLDAPAAMQLNYSYTSAQQKQNETNFTLYQLATYNLPMLQTVLFLLLIGVFPLVVLLSLFPPMTEMVLKNYIIALAYICSWPLFYAVANFIFSASLSMDMGAYQGVSFSNLSQIADKDVNFTSTAGYILSLVPFLPILVVKGFAAGLSQISQYFGGIQHNLASSSGSEAATGNIGIGNMNYGNRSWLNTSANKFDTNTTHYAGASTTQGQDGVLTTTYPDSSQVINANGAISQGALSLNFASLESNSLQKSLTNSLNSAHNESVAAENLLQSAFNRSTNMSQGHVRNESLHYASSQEEATDVANAFRSMQSIAEDVGRKQGLSDANVGSTVSQLVAAANAHAGLGLPPVSVVKAGVDGSVTLSGTSSSRHDTSESSDLYNSLTAVQQKQFSQDLQTVSRYGSRISADSNTQQDLSLSDQQAYSLYQSQQHAERASADYQQAEGYQSQLSQIQSDSQSWNMNRTQAFIEWGSRLSGEESYQFKTLIDQSMKGTLSSNSERYLSAYIDKFEQDQAFSLVSIQALDHAPLSVHQQFESHKQGVDIHNQSPISGSFQQGSGKLHNQYQPDVRFDKNQYESLTKNVNEMISGNQQKVSQGENEVVNNSTDLTQQVNQDGAKFKNRANEGAAHLGIDSVVDNTKSFSQYLVPQDTKDKFKKE